jgi:hypothetical protein
MSKPPMTRAVDRAVQTATDLADMLSQNSAAAFSSEPQDIREIRIEKMTITIKHLIQDVLEVGYRWNEHRHGPQ